MSLARLVALRDRGAAAVEPLRVRAADTDPAAGWLVGPVTRLAAFAAAFQGLVHVSNARLDGRKILAADVDNSVWAWASTGFAFAAGLAVALTYLSQRGRLPTSERVVLLLSAGGLLFLSLDDLTRVHEKVATIDIGILAFEEGGRIVWPLLYLPLLATVFVGLWLASTGRGPSSRAIRFGLVLLATAVVAEVASPAFLAGDLSYDDWPYIVEVAIEEGMELAGWMLIAAGLLEAATVVLREVGTRD